MEKPRHGGVAGKFRRRSPPASVATGQGALEPVLQPDLLPGDGFLCGVLLHSAHAVLDASRGQESPRSEQLEAAVRPAKTGIALSFLRPAAPMVRPLSLLRRPAERHDPHDESAGSGACPAFSPAQGAAPLQVRLRRTRTHPPCTRRRGLLFRKRLALTAGLPHIERRRVQRLHPCPRNRPTGNVRLLGPGTGRPTIRTRRRYAPLPDYPDAERRSLVGSSPVWRRLGAGQRILRFDATGFRPALESHDGRSATHPSRDVRQRKTRTYRTAERWPCGVDHTSLPCGTSRALSRGFLEFSPLGQSSANSGADATLRSTLSRHSAYTTRVRGKIAVHPFPMNWFDFLVSFSRFICLSLV